MQRMLACLLLIFGAVPPAASQEFPVTAEHALGTATVPAPPQRIVSAGYHEQDFLYALGLAPVGVHEWFGGYPYATWPWAEEARQKLGAAPEVQRGFEIDVEWVLAQQPDLIVATFAPLDARTYSILSQIAPVLGPPPGYPAWGAPWEEELRLIAKATGRSQEAEQVIEGVGRRIADTARAYPQLNGLSGTAAHFAGGQLVGYRRSAGVNRLLGRLGLQTPDSFDGLAGPGGNFSASLERADLFDLDGVLWLVDSTARARIESLPSYHGLRLAREGRSVWADPVLMGAMSFQSPLSISWALDRLGPMLAAAADGDPATPVPAPGL